MLGIAAGVAKCSDLLQPMAVAFRDIEKRSPRWAAIGALASWLAADSHDAAHAEETAKVVVEYRAASLGFGDLVALLCLAAEVLDTPLWNPDDAFLSAFDDSTRRYVRVIVMEVPGKIAPLDAAMLLRGLAAAPSERLARRSALDQLLSVIESFPASAELLGRRPQKRCGIEIVDEYDVQWIFHALLVPFIPDLVPEDPAPRVAGKSSRLDFSTKQARVGIEIKHIRKEADIERIRGELMIDALEYPEHPYVDTVVSFVYDPKQHLALSRRAAFERDLSRSVAVSGRTLSYVTRVR